MVSHYGQIHDHITYLYCGVHTFLSLEAFFQETIAKEGSSPMIDSILMGTSGCV